MNQEKDEKKAKKNKDKKNKGVNINNTEAKTSETIEENIESEEILEEQENYDNKLAEEMKDKWQRTLAEFDNFRKRTDKEKTGMYDEGAKNVCAKILPVLDNFERALKSSENKDDGFYKGVEMIYKQLEAALEALGVSKIDATGSFNIDLHDAVMHVEDESFGENEIIEELQKGYKYKDKVIRHSMVKVAN